MDKFSLVITSIASESHPVLKSYAKFCQNKQIKFIVIGDQKSPANFHLPGCEFWGIEKQKTLPFKFAQIAPYKHYSRKNIGYLLAIREGSEIILETDDDNIPMESFWEKREKDVHCRFLDKSGWTNAYYFFGKNNIWPRGFPLEKLKDQPTLPSAEIFFKECPIQQGLANENPDVDAVYRLTQPLPYSFKQNGNLALGKGSWCPFNSQNTTWFRQAFPLLYLPSTCSFRMTDIWRSFVAQRIGWEYGWNVLFHDATVTQDRNEHNLLNDFADEVEGYLNNAKICKILDDIEFNSAPEAIFENLHRAYQTLVGHALLKNQEMSLLEAWIEDIKKC